MDIRSSFASILSAGLLLMGSSADGQSLLEFGYFPHNGIFAISGFDHFMLTGAGHVVDVEDPYVPQLVGSVNAGIGTAVIVNGQQAYFGTGMVSTVRIVDLSIPSAPITVGTLSLPSSSGCYGLAVDGNMLYAANAQQGLASIDISNPAAPELIQQLSLGGQQTRGVVVLDGLAYVADGGGLKVIDISDPADMQELSSIGGDYVSVALDTAEQRVVVGRTGGGAIVFGLSDRTAPQVLYGIPGSDGTAHSVQVLYGNLYVSAEQFGVRVYSMGETSAALLGEFNNASNGQTFGAYALGELIFVGGLVNGAAVVGWGTVGVEDASSSLAALSCYPVPATDHLNWSAPEGLVYDAVHVTDASGSTVRMDHRARTGIDVSGLASGPYVIWLMSGRTMVARSSFLKAD